jgi:hypothetical protein
MNDRVVDDKMDFTGIAVQDDGFGAIPDDE